MPLPLEQFDSVRPRERQVLVERDEQPERYGTFIILPPSYRAAMKSSVATVRAVGEGVRHLRRGDRVVVASGTARRIIFGEREERTLYVCEPEQIIALLLDESETARIEELGERLEGRFPQVSDRMRQALEGKSEQGFEKR